MCPTFFSLSSFKRALLLFVELQPQLCGLWRTFVAQYCPIFLFNRLIGLHISMCCDSVSFDFIKPATTVARFIQHSCLFIFSSVSYRKVRNRKCKQSSSRVGPCFEHMPWYKTGHYGRHNVIYGKAWYSHDNSLGQAVQGTANLAN